MVNGASALPKPCGNNSSRSPLNDYSPFTIDHSPTAMYENINVEFDAGVATITLNRPEKLNALAGHMRRDLAEALEAAGSDRAVHVVVITGSGRGFCAGGDVAAMADLIERQDADEFSRLLGSARRGVTAIRHM